MFFFDLFGQVILIYLLAAVLPAAVLMVYVYRQDSIQKQPVGLLLHLAGGGVAAALLAIILEWIGTAVLNITVSVYNPWYEIFLAFLVVGAAEEGMKFFILKKRTWENPCFRCRFDAIVYAVAVSLGFAAFENIGYVFGYGITVAPLRALLAIPGHMSFAVFMGFFYGKARQMEDYHHHTASIFFQVLAWLAAVFFHGFYDACSMIGTGRATLIFILFVIIMYVVSFGLIRHEAKNDERFWY
jgi:RsiW-degrading membrane proteinase PrsW (M82 family)